MATMGRRIGAKLWVVSLVACVVLAGVTARSLRTRDTFNSMRAVVDSDSSARAWEMSVSTSGGGVAVYVTHYDVPGTFGRARQLSDDMTPYNYVVRHNAE